MNPSSLGLRWRILEIADREQRRLQERQNRRRFRAFMRRNVNPFTAIPDSEFTKSFRLSKHGVRDLADDIISLIPQERRRDGIPPIMKILIALSFLATGSYQTLVGQSALHNVSQASVSRALKQVTVALKCHGNVLVPSVVPSVFKKYVKWPLERDERNFIKSRFYRKFKFPGLLGCIDGTHVAILRPAHHEERFFNRKGYHSLNVMIICNSDLNIMCVDASTPGSAHDASVWQSHPLSNHLHLLQSEEDTYLLGDSGYPLRRTMVTPILNTIEGTPEHNFYMAHVRARNTVERCIGVLKARFRCLLAARALHYSPSRAGQIVNACVVLHNLANQGRTPFDPLTPEEREEEYHRQIQNLRADADDILCANSVERRRHVSSDLIEGRALQRALMERLWRERNIS